MIPSEWDANGSPIDRPLDDIPPTHVRTGSISDLFLAYREALSQSLTDGNVMRLDAAHEALRDRVRSVR